MQIKSWFKLKPMIILTALVILLAATVFYLSGIMHFKPWQTAALYVAAFAVGIMGTRILAKFGAQAANPEAGAGSNTPS
ncbi:MAG: hypothetical protein K2P57_08735 [Burkholderiales bacterium]|nr:hypothetical protein [Burkholderiales bacterium]